MLCPAIAALSNQTIMWSCNPTVRPGVPRRHPFHHQSHGQTAALTSADLCLQGGIASVNGYTVTASGMNLSLPTKARKYPCLVSRPASHSFLPVGFIGTRTVPLGPTCPFSPLSELDALLPNISFAFESASGPVNLRPSAYLIYSGRSLVGTTRTYTYFVYMANAGIRDDTVRGGF